jgi:uncharacterized protein
MLILIQFAIGLVFGLGLLISGMSNPAKVLNFLDLAAIGTGSWDPSLMFVMIGAVVTAFIGFRLVLKWPQPILARTFHLPPRRDLDVRIFTGPAIFGIGWGLAGLCPGPAFVALGYGSSAPILFMISMMIGMAGARALADRQPALAAPS